MKLPGSKWSIINSLGIVGFVLSGILTFVLVVLYFNAKKNLFNASKNLKAIGNGIISDTVTFDSVIRLDTEISILRTIPVNLKMTLNDSLKIAMTKSQPLSLKIPINLDINQLLHVDTTLTLADTLKLTTNGDISIDQKFTVFRKFKIPLKSSIPLKNEVLSAKLQGATWFTSDIPIRLNINDSLPVELNLIIPINQKAKIDYLIKKSALISFPQKLRIKGLIPIHLKIPIQIELSKTVLKKYLDSTASDLNKILSP
jgi:hypothetical protein